MIVTIDTNVFFQAFVNARGPAGYIYWLIQRGEITPALSIPTYLEYEAVLKREENLAKIGIDLVQLNDLLELVRELGVKVDISYLWRPNLRDEADNMFVELAIISSSQFLITNNVRDFTIANELKFDDLRIITPVEFTIMWRQYYE